MRDLAILVVSSASAREEGGSARLASSARVPVSASVMTTGGKMAHVIIFYCSSSHEMRAHLRGGSRRN